MTRTVAGDIAGQPVRLQHGDQPACVFTLHTTVRGVAGYPPIETIVLV